MLRVIMVLLGLSLVLAWLLTPGQPVHLVCSRHEPRPQPAALMGPLDWPKEVKGFGLTATAARQDALEQTRQKLAGFLRFHGLTAFQPTAAYVAASLVVGPGQSGPELPLPDNLGVARTWVFSVQAPNLSDLRRLNDITLQQLRRQQQEEQLEGRLWLLRRLLALVLSLLAAVLAYIRLDEWTHGRYTRWWRSKVGSGQTRAAGGYTRQRG